MKKLFAWFVVLIGLMGPVSSVGATTSTEAEVMKKYVGTEKIELGSRNALEPIIPFENGKVRISTNGVKKFIVLPKDTTQVAFKKQMPKITELSYSNTLKPEDSGGNGWTLVEFKSYSVSSLQVAVFKKKVTGSNKYYYTFAFRGSKEFMDYVEDVTTVINNTVGLQLTTAEKYVKDILKREGAMIQNVYFTDFGSFMKENATAYEEDGEGRIKIYYRFKEDGWFNNVYDATEYEGKACTFYLDEKDLVTLEKWKQGGSN